MGARLIAVFAVSFAVFTVAPTLLPQQFAGGPILRWGEVVDLLAPLVLVSGYYLLFRSADDWAAEPPSGPMIALFLVGALLFIEGHGMHLAANSISHFFAGAGASPARDATYFYDEVLGHYVWDAGRWGLAAVLLFRHYQPTKRGVDLWDIQLAERVAIIAAGLLYGLTLALSAIEGQTVGLDLPAAAVVSLLFALFWLRQKHLPGAPVFTFVGLGYVAATLLIGAWGLYWRGFPQFSDLGIIH